MLKKAAVLLVFMVFCVLSLQVLTHGNNEVDFTINGQPADFSAPVIRDSSGKLYAPMTEFFEKTNIQYVMLPEERVVLFRDNIFIKFQLQFNTFELNGKEMNWEVAPFRRGDTLYISLQEMTQYMSLNYTIDEEANRVDLHTATNIEQTHISDFYAKRIEDAATGLSFDVDYHWQRDGNVIGTSNSHSFIEMRTRVLDAPAFADVDQNIRKFLDEQVDSDARNRFIKERTFTGRFTEFDIFHYRRTRQEGLEDLTLSYAFFSLGQNIYVIEFRTDSTIPQYLEDVENRILNTVKSRQFNIDPREEHYIEFNNFFDQDTFIESPLYSNMMVSGSLPFKGLINERVSFLDVRVERSNRVFDYRIRVNGGKFDDEIPIPFDLGFHRVTITVPQYIAETSNSLGLERAEHLLMQFSVLNDQAGMGLYISSSTKVDTRNPEMVAMLQKLPVRTTNRDQASLCFDLLKEFYYDSEIQSMEELLDKGKGNSHAISALYTAMLRAYQIPTRMISDAFTNTYYVEFQSNGLWVFNDPTSFVRGLREKEAVFHIKRPDKITFVNHDY